MTTYETPKGTVTVMTWEEYQIKKQMSKIYIGIDPGVKTGIAIWNSETKRLNCYTTKLHKAFIEVLRIAEELGRERVLIRMEDARLRKNFGNSGREKLQGAGSVKRDCKIWEDFLTDFHIKFEKVSPLQKGKKVSDRFFKQLTGYTGITSEHSRDAAMLVYGL